MPFKLIREDLDLSLIDGLVVLNKLDSEKITKFELKILKEHNYIKPIKNYDYRMRDIEIIILLYTLMVKWFM